MEQKVQKQVLKRNILFWGSLAEKYIGVTFLIIWFYVIFFSYIGGKKIFGTEEMWEIWFTYQVMLLLVSTVVVPMSYGMVYIPLVMSFGSRRDETVWGFQIVNWLVLGEMGGLLVLFACFSSLVSKQGVCLILLGGVIGMALGQFSTALGLRFGMKGVWFVTMLIMVLIVTGGGVLGLIIARMGEIVIQQRWLWIAAGAAVVLYIGSIFTLRQIVRNYEVRR